MNITRRLRPAAALLAIALVATACGGDDDDSADDDAASSSPSGESAYTTDLTEDCPDPFVVQKDWLAEAEHAAFY
jgi:ABC-type glycerol-3-phosphate transport system substrate-binding protein